MFFIQDDLFFDICFEATPNLFNDYESIAEQSINTLVIL